MIDSEVLNILTSENINYRYINLKPVQQHVVPASQASIINIFNTFFCGVICYTPLLATINFLIFSSDLVWDLACVEQQATPGGSL